MTKSKNVLITGLLCTVAMTSGFSQQSIHTVEVEAESFSRQTKDDVRKWYVKSDPNASNEKYIQILPDTRVTHDDKLIAGTNFSNTPGQMAIISYDVKIPEPGRYYVWARVFSSGSEDNGLHVGVDGQWPESGARLQWCEGKNQWFYDSKQRTNEVHCGEPYLIYLDIEEKGMHEIQFSMREDGIKMDKFLLTTNRDFEIKN